jgi:hypothetical protein
MGCSSKCGSDQALIELIVNNAIFKAINDHVIQAALKDCDGNWMGAETRVVTCATLATQICTLFQDGDLCIDSVTAFSYNPTSFILTLTTTGNTFAVDLSSLADATTDTFVVSGSISGNTMNLVRNDTGTVAVDLTPLTSQIRTYVNCLGASIPNGASIATCSDLTAAINTVTGSIPQYVSCTGVAITTGASLATCSDLSTAIAGIGPIPAYVDCNGAPVLNGAALATCSDLVAAISGFALQAVPAPSPGTELPTLVIGDRSELMGKPVVMVELLPGLFVPAYNI